MAKVARGHRGPPQKSLDSDENFKPENTLFCNELRFVAIYALCGYLWAKGKRIPSSATLGYDNHDDDDSAQGAGHDD